MKISFWLAVLVAVLNAGTSQAESPLKFEQKVVTGDKDTFRFISLQAKVTDTRGGGIQSIAREVKGAYALHKEALVTFAFRVFNQSDHSDTCSVFLTFTDKDGFKVLETNGESESFVTVKSEELIQWSKWIPENDVARLKVVTVVFYGEQDIKNMLRKYSRYAD